MSNRRTRAPKRVVRTPLFAAAAVIPLIGAGCLTLSPPALAAAGTSQDIVTKTCSGSVNGQPVKVQFSITYAASSGARADDVRRLAVRATDNGEYGSWRNSKVNISSIRVKMYTEAQRTTVNRVGYSSPFSVTTDPYTRSSGKDALSMMTAVNFTSGGRSTNVTCMEFTF